MMVGGKTHTKRLNLKLNKSPTHLFTISFTLNEEFEKLNSTFQFLSHIFTLFTLGEQNKKKIKKLNKMGNYNLPL